MLGGDMRLDGGSVTSGAGNALSGASAAAPTVTTTLQPSRRATVKRNARAKRTGSAVCARQTRK